MVTNDVVWATDDDYAHTYVDTYDDDDGDGGYYDVHDDGDYAYYGAGGYDYGIADDWLQWCWWL